MKVRACQLLSSSIYKLSFILVFISYRPCLAANTSLNQLELLEAKVEIAGMVAKDQTLRNELIHSPNYQGKYSESLLAFWKAIDNTNTRTLKNILNRWGWPTEDSFGDKYVNYIWLLVQHADQDVNFQKQSLIALEKACLNEPEQKRYYVYLLDRVKINERLPQIYGTQGFCTKHNQWHPFPIYEVTQLSKRRQNIGLESFETYQTRMNLFCP